MSKELYVVPRGAGIVMRRLRTEKNMTQASLAYEAEINVSYYCSVENGENNISLVKFMAICRALSEPADRVMSLIMDHCAESDQYRSDSAHSGQSNP